MIPKIDRRLFLGASGLTLTSALLPWKAMAQAVPPIDAYATPLVEHIALSPDGTRVAIMSDTGTEKVLVHFAIADPKPVKLFLGPSKIRNLIWGDNDHVVVVSSETLALDNFVGNKHEFARARMINLKTAKVTTLFTGQNGYYDIIAGDLHRIRQNDGYRLTASNYSIMGAARCLFTFEMDKPFGKLVAEGRNGSDSFVVTPNGYPLAYSNFDDSKKVWSLYFNTAEFGKTAKFVSVYENSDALRSPDVYGLGRDGQSVVIYVEGNEDGDFYEIARDGKLSAPLDPDGDDRSRSPLFHPTTWCLAGFSRHDDWAQPDYTDPVLKKMTDALPAIMGEGTHNYIVEFADDPRKVIVYTESATDAGSYVFVDFSTGDVSTVAVNYESIPEALISVKKPIDYKAADGLDIHAYLTLPPGKPAQNLPLVVLPHGGPQARDYADFDWQAQVLAAHGYAVLQPNFRGSEGYGQDFIDAGHGEFGRKMQTDLSDGVADLVKQGLVDPKRVAIMGASYGGYAAQAGATLQSGIYSCAISIAGVCDPQAQIDWVASNRGKGYDSVSVLYWREFMGDPKTYDVISPLRQADKASCPILLIHGTDDTVVPADQSRRMEAALKRAGKPVEFVTFKGQDHWETIGPARIDMMKAAITFLSEYNPA